MPGQQLCQKCSHFEATVHITLVSQGMVAQLHLCPRCEAKDSGKQEKTCSRCGMTFHQIQARGRFGCPDDYTVFGEEVVKALERYHGSSGHIGKKPREDYF